MKSIFHNLLFAMSLGTVMSLQMGGSCASSGGDSSGGNSNDTYDHTSDNYREHDRPNRIPRWSDLVREGSGKLKWQSDLDGEVYVYDASKDYIAYTGPVRRGQEIVVVPDDDKVYVNKHVVSSENLRKDSTHQIYFARQRKNNSSQSNQGSSSGIPRGAVKATEGGGQISYRLRGNGTIYVFDVDANKIVLQQSCRNNQTVTVIPGKDHIDVDGRSVFSGNLERNHAHRIYFVKN